MNFSLTLFGLTLAAFAAHSAYACSICRCGDPTFNALGKEGVSLTGLRVAVDWDRVEKTQGTDEDKESLTESRMTLFGAYAVNDRVSVFARVPYSWRTLHPGAAEGFETTKTSGLADPEIYGQVRVWASTFEGDVGIRSGIYVIGGVKTGWGTNRMERDGERLEEHVQPGTGSTDWFAGLASSYQLSRDSVLFASTQYRSTGSNELGYQYGNAWLANLAYEHKFSSWLDSAIEANYRHAERDRIDHSAARDQDTGGSVLYITPRILLDVGHGWVVRAAAQIPTSQSGLNGNQTEKTVFNLGLTKVFLR